MKAKAKRTVYKPDGTLTDTALTDVILWTERRGLNLIELAKELDTTPKDLGLAIQRAKAHGAYADKRKELIEKNLLKRNKPVTPQAEPKPDNPKMVFDFGPKRPEPKQESEPASEPEPEHEPDPEPAEEPEPVKVSLARSAAAIPSRPRGMTKREYAQMLLNSGMSPEDAARAAEYASVKRMQAAILASAKQMQKFQEEQPATPSHEFDSAMAQAENEAAPIEDATPDAPPIQLKSLIPAFLGEEHVYVLDERGLDITHISGDGFIPWDEIEEVMEIRHKGAGA